MNLTGWLTDILNFVFPATCHVCDGSLAPHERFACSHCLNILPRTGFHRRPLNPMEERFAGHFPFEHATGHFFYTRDSALSILIHDMKYRHFPAIGEMLGELVAQELFTSGFFNEMDMIIPMPMHFLKQASRGYNQTHHIAKGISRATGISIAYNLKASHPHKTQTSLTPDQRRLNTTGIFTVEKPDQLAGKNILLVDDICTTGSTLSSAGKILTDASPSIKLHILTLGVTF